MCLALKEKFLKAPETTEQWLHIARTIESEWNFVNCLGAIDRKHISTECPKNSGSMYFNYKNFHNTVLMVCCDTNYTFAFM